MGRSPGDILITSLRLKLPGAAIALTGVAAGAVVLLLGIAGAVLGTQCASQGGQLGICPQPGDVAAVRSPAKAEGTVALPAAIHTVQEPVAPVAPPVAPPEAAATLSAHDLIEASLQQLLLAQAERPLFGGSVGAEGETGDGAGPGAAPEQLAYAAPPAPVLSDRAVPSSSRAEFGPVLPPAVLPEEIETESTEAAALGGPLLPPLPEPEPLALPMVEPDAGGAPEAEAAEAPEALPVVEPDAGGPLQLDEAEAPVATAVRIGDSRVNVRAGPSTEEARLFRLDPGEQVMATESTGGWRKIEDAAGRAGWVHSDLLAPTGGDTRTAAAAAPAAAAPADPPAAPAPEAPAADAPAEAATRTVAGTAVSVRDAPSNSGARLFALAAGEDVTVSGSDKGWLQIVDGRGRTGWAYSDFFKPAP